MDYSLLLEAFKALAPILIFIAGSAVLLISLVLITNRKDKTS
jgi:hypothetical protein